MLFHHLIKIPSDVCLMIVSKVQDNFLNAQKEGVLFLKCELQKWTANTVV